MRWILVSFYYANILIDFKGDKNDEIITRSIRKCLNVDAEAIKKTPEVFHFIIQIISKMINTVDIATEKDKMNKIFKIVHPFKGINYKAALFVIPFFGRSLLIALKRMLRCLIVLTSILLLLFMTAEFNGKVFEEIILGRTGILTAIFVFVFFYFLPLYLDSKQQYKMSNKKYSTIPFIDALLSKLLADEREQVLDIGNLNLWYQVCLETGISKETLRKEIPAYLIRDFEKNSLAKINS